MKPKTMSLAIGAALGAATLLAAVPALAQLAQKSDAPVDITADELEVINASCQAIWKGNAEALQDTARLRADVIKIFNTPGAAKAGSTGPNCGVMQRMEATGSVYYLTTAQKVRSNAAVYTADNTTIVMTGDVVAVQGQNVLRGDRMTYNTETGAGQMQGSKGGKIRPRAVFYPKAKDTTTAPAK